MLSDYFLYSALGGGTGAASGGYPSLSYPLTAASTTAAVQAAAQLGEKIGNETAKIAAYEELQSAVAGFQAALEGFDVSDEAGATAAAQAFVDSYNILAGTIAELTGPDGTLEGDTTATQLVSALQNELSATFAATGSFDKLYQIGIAPESDGTLTLDSTTFAAAYAADSAGVGSLLTETAATFDATADAYSAGGGLIEVTKEIYGDNLLDLQLALPALESMGAQTQSYANAQYASAIYALYGSALGENLVTSFSETSAISFFA